MTLRWLPFATAICCASLGGFYWAYATVMAAQRSADDAQATAAMVRMNAAVERWPFLTLFLIAPLGALVTLACVPSARPGATASLAAAVSAICMLAATISTIAVNVPLNQSMARHGIDWADFVAQWAPWNVVRLALSLAAAAGLTLSAYFWDR